MNYKIKLWFTPKKGKKVYEPGYQDHVSLWLLQHEGQRCYETLSVETKPNSRPQQKYFWGVIVESIAAETGDTPQHVYETLQPVFFKYTDSKGREYIRSTELGEWTTIEWEEKMNEIRSWAQDFLNLRIPLPNEADY